MAVIVVLLLLFSTSAFQGFFAVREGYRVNRSEALMLPTEDLNRIAVRAADDLASMCGAHLLMTGCTGFVGKWLLEALLYADRKMGLGLHFTIVSRAPDRFLASMPHLNAIAGLDFIEGDVASVDVWEVPFTHAIHGANLPYDGRYDWQVRHMETATRGTANVMAAAGKCGCQAVLYISSGAARGPWAAPNGEEGNTAAVFSEGVVYGLTKRFTEAYAVALGSLYGVRVPCARPFALAGPYMALDRGQALGNFFANALAGRDIIVKGDGTAVRSYMYGADLAVWILAILARGRHGVTYDVGSCEALTIADAAEAVRRAFPEKRLGLRVLGCPTHGLAPARYVPDTTMCEDELALSCEGGLEQICAKTAKWLGRNAITI